MTDYAASELLPYSARVRLIAAAHEPSEMLRIVAVDKAIQAVKTEFPEYFRPEAFRPTETRSTYKRIKEY